MPPVDPEAQLRKQWADSLRTEMAEWYDVTSGQRGMTVKQLAQAFEAEGLGVSKAAIYAWLDGQYSPRLTHQRVLAKILGVKVRHLFPLDAA